MGDVTSIGWCDRTYNPWRGCSVVGPGCERCYAMARDQRYEGGSHWGPGAPRIRASQHTLNGPVRWNREAEKLGHPLNVFCLSLGDLFDNEVDDEWRAGLYRTWRETPNLRWIPVTKRIGNAERMLPRDWPHAYPNVGMMITVVDQDEYDRDIAKLLEIPAAWHGLSIEPQLGPVCVHTDAVDWVIVGGESAQVLDGHRQPGREFHVEWAEAAIADGRENGAAVFVKQLGSTVMWGGARVDFGDRQAGADTTQWPFTLVVREFPKALRHA